MKKTLKALRGVKADPAVSIFVNTHRTHPDNEQDSIALKNQLTEAKNRLESEYDKRTADEVVAKIDEKLADLDHNYNLDTLAVFATKEEATLLRLPFDTKARVVLGHKFATRDLVRDLSQSVHYYVLVITSENARLIEGVNNRLVKEVDNQSVRQEQMSELTFPIKNTTLPTGSKADKTGSSDDDKYLKEFLNRVDKSLQQFINIDPLPVILVGDSRTLGFYEQVCDNSSVIIGKVDKLANLKDGKPEDIIEGVQEVVENERSEAFDIALGELAKARNENMVRTDLQQIYRSALEGNATMLLVRQGHSVPASIDEEKATLIVKDDATAEGVNDDGVSEIIELVLHNGAKVVFLPKDKMDEKEPIALITRY
ncbi:hypothetical protein [Moraxella boevrei]|uniref:AOC03_06830 family ribosome hibernation factor n=1 Tax=Faucicola boevrei TaxID=346665 RepID=UPI003734F00A